MRVLIITTAVLGLLSLNTVAAQDFPGKGRLKYKRGPVCMCDKGLNEKDIQAAEAERKRSQGLRSLDKLNPNESSQNGKEEE